jgi:magnesium transporter
MLTAYVVDRRGCLAQAETASEMPLPSAAVWLDLVSPTADEDHRVEALLGVAVPTREEMQEIEASSRLYEEDGALYMTATVLARSETDYPEASAVTFILSGDRLVTVRHAEPQPFAAFVAKGQRSPGAYDRGDTILAGLLDAIIDRLADILERVGMEVDDISRTVFQHAANPGSSFRDVLRRLGRKGDLTSKARESVFGIERLLIFFSQSCARDEKGRDLRTRVETMIRDVRSLADHSSFLSGKINFLLDATLGMINIEQSATIKIFSVVAVVFLPPTLIASIYGMNFDFMPELHWWLGYPLAIALMVASAIAPYLYFKRRGWL